MAISLIVRSQQTPPITQLREFLKSHLPDHLLPSTFVFLESFPQTPNGKVDHRSLPIPDLLRPVSKETFVMPCNSVEETLAEIWAQVLTLEQIGINDNFFELGGHSLLATWAVSRIREVFKFELPLRRFFEAPR
jgi:hypothetical protein